ncbi:MAG: VOC family protein [Bacteroidota bacterium]
MIRGSGTHFSVIIVLIIKKIAMENVKAIPHNYHSLVTYINVKNASKAIEFYKEIFGAKEMGRVSMPGNIVGHAELKIGDSRLMIAEEMPEWGNKSPQTLGGSPVRICFYVDNVDEVFKRALDAGAKVEGNMDVKDQFYGDRSGNLVDPFGHIWIISTHIEDVDWEETQKRSDKMMEDAKK